MSDLFLKRHGIEVNRELNETEKTIIASKVSAKLIEKFPNIKGNFFYLYTCLFNTKMYFADIKGDVSRVNYSYYDLSIYFSNKININNITNEMVHECLHRIQHVSKNKLGLCDLKKGTGVMLNEGANQYIVNKIINNKYNYISKLGIKMNTYASNHYPLITDLVEEIAILVGDSELVNGTLLADGSFEKTLKSYFGVKTFLSIRDSLDEIMNYKVAINKFNKAENINKLSALYYETRKSIYENYYNFVKIYDYEDAKVKLNLLKEKFQNTENYEQFLMFYIDKMNEIKNYELSTLSLTVVNKNNIVNKLFSKLGVLSKLLNIGYSSENSDK